MKWFSRLAFVVGVVAVAAFGPELEAFQAAGQPPVPTITNAGFGVVHGWPLLPDNTIFDEVSAVAVDSRGDVLVLQRGGRKWPDSDVLDQTAIALPTVFVFDGRTGRPLAVWGEKLFALPHSLTVDDRDNVWVTDVALHQVFKFSHDGKRLLTLGERGVAGNDNSHFDRPTDVAVASDGSFYVSDGYRNSRVVKFAADGTFLFTWGTKGKGPGQFDLPHGIALDAAGRVFVVDRQNARVQVFDGQGKSLPWKSPPFVNPQDIAIGTDGTVFVTDIGDEKLPDRSGVHVMRSDGSLLGRFGRYGNYDGQFLVAHGVAVGKDGAVYVADFTGRRVQKFLRTNAGVAQAPEIATAVAFTEGPTVDRDGNVYFTEMVSQRILKLSAAGVLSTFREQSNNANGLLVDPQGLLVACEGADSQRTGVLQKFKPQITRTDLRTGRKEVLADNYQGQPFVGPNDVTIDGKGRLYFTDLPGGAVYRIDGPGQLARILAAPDIQRPNGIQISPDDKQLYLIEANGAEGGARMIRAYDLHPDGTVGNMRVHYNFYPGRSADGMSIDTQGNLYASAGMNQLRGTSETLDTRTGIYVISPQGTLLKFIPIQEDFITNNAFGGSDMKTLYVTAGKTLYKVRTDVAGLPR